MKVYDLYGVVCRGLDEAKTIVEGALDITLVAHESGYHCGDYYRHKDVGEEHFILQKNYDSFDDEWTEPDNKDMPFLLYVNETIRSDELRDKLERLKEVELLKHQEIELHSKPEVPIEP